MDIFQPYPGKEPELSRPPELLLSRDFSELLPSELLGARSQQAPSFPFPISHRFKALSQTLKSCSPEPQRLRLSRAGSEMFLLLL